MKRNRLTKKPGKGSAKPNKKENRFPPDWNEQKVQRVIAHYDSLSDDELVAEIETAAAAGQTLVSVPTELVPEVVKFIKHRQRSA